MKNCPLCQLACVITQNATQRPPPPPTPPLALRPVLTEYATCSFFFFTLLSFGSLTGLLFSSFRNFQTAVKCSNVAQKSYCKFEKDVAYIIENSYTWSCSNETEIGNGRKNVSGGVCISAGFCFTIFVLVLQLLQEIFQIF